MSSPLPQVHLWSLDELNPWWNTPARICRTCALCPLQSLAAYPTSLSFDLQVLWRTSPPRSHGPFWEPLTAEEVRDCSSGGPTVGTTPRWEMRLRPGRAFRSPRSQQVSPPSHILKHFYYQEGSACKFQNLPAGSLRKECGNRGMKGNPERQGNGCGWLLMGPSSHWAVSPVSLKHTFGVQVQQGGGVLWFVEFCGGEKERREKSLILLESLFLKNWIF